MAAAAVMRASHRAARVTAAPAAVLRSLSHEVRDMRPLESPEGPGLGEQPGSSKWRQLIPSMSSSSGSRGP